MYIQFKKKSVLFDISIIWRKLFSVYEQIIEVELHLEVWKHFNYTQIIIWITPSHALFPQTNSCKQLEWHAPPETLVRYHPSGWTQGHLFIERFKHFLCFTNPTTISPVLLTSDGHDTPAQNLNVIEEARRNHAIILSLSPHTTHKLLPLNKIYMGVFKDKYSNTVRLFTQRMGCAALSSKISELFAEAYLQSQCAAYVVSSFRVSR